MLRRQIGYPFTYRGGELVVGTKLQETCVGALGIVDPSDLGVRVSQVGVGQGAHRVEHQGFLVPSDGFGQLIHLHVGKTKDVRCQYVVGLVLQGRCEGLGGVWTALVAESVGGSKTVGEAGLGPPPSGTVRTTGSFFAPPVFSNEAVAAASSPFSASTLARFSSTCLRIFSRVALSAMAWASS